MSNKDIIQKHNLANLAMLSGGASFKNTKTASKHVKSYDMCKSEKVSKVMKEFENKDLKDKTGKVIKNQKQAIAIALSQVQNSCQYNPQDVKKLVEKVNQLIYLI